jgi:poly-gamma-glutamate synthesis protein (capsule biosynthesis protein)
MEKTIKISLVGDIFPSNIKYTKGFGNGSIFLQDFGKAWEIQLKKIFMDSSITFGNLEAPLIEDSKIVNDSPIAGSKYFANTLRNGGFNIVSIANNHILEKGHDGFISTQDALSQAGVKYVGVFNEYKSNIVVLEKNQLKFGFAAFNAIKDIPNPNVHADLQLENIKKTLDEMNSLRIDYKLLSFHWGNEYINIPSYDQIKLAHSTIDYGADIIIGHHPHVIQPIERYKNGIIIYSLGNFIFDFLFSKEFKLGMLVDLYVNGDDKIEYKVSEVQLEENKLKIINNSSLLLNKLINYESKMNDLMSQPKDVYISYYNNKLKINRFYQRIMMKLKLIELLIFSNYRKQLLINLYNKLITLF